MKLAAILIFASAMQVSANGYGQKVTIKVKNAPVEQVLGQIKQQTGLAFIWDESILKETHPITVDVKNASVEEALNACLKDQPLTYSIKDNLVEIRQKTIPISAFQPGDTPPPPIDIHGRVTDSLGKPLAGASVTVKGSKRGTSTDVNGNFVLTGVTDNATLVISFTGYLNKIYKINGTNEVSVFLNNSNSPLDEVQIMAYGNTTQRFSTGSYSKVTSEQISQQPVTNPLQALEGRVPGLTVSQTSGLPGASVKIQIRGQNNLNSAIASGINPLDNPLFIVDGVPIAAQNTNLNQFSSIIAPGTSLLYNNPYGGLSPFNSLNPEDIESIEILRDADATAIYGSRGANGVIIITTKRGTEGKTAFTANVYSGQSQITRTVPMLKTSDYLKLRREAYANDNLVPSSDPNDAAFAPDLTIYDTSSYTDWKKYFLGGTGKTTDAHASISGGNTNTQFLVGAGFHHETYIFPGDFKDVRGSFNMNLHHQSADKKLSLDLSANYSVDQNNSASPNILTAFTLPPDYPALQNPDGTLNWSYKGLDLGNDQYWGNPMSYLKRPYTANTHNLISHLELGYQILPGLTVRSSFGYNTTEVKENSQIASTSLDPMQYNPYTSSASFGSNEFRTWIVEPQAEYKKMIGKGKLDLLVGGTLQETTNNSTSINGINFPNDGLLGSIQAAGSITAANANSQYNYAAFFGRMGYVWNNKYLVNVSGRRDGSSRFGPGKQFGNFGSVGAGWIFSAEPWFKQHFSTLSYGKLRGSYGTTGSDNIANYQYLSAWSSTYFAYEGSRGLVPQNLYNPDFNWALNKKMEMALETGFLNDRFLASATWYRNRSNNQLILYLLPAQTGFNFVIQNFTPLIQNSGWEFQLSSVNIRSKQVTWKTSFNISIPKNKLVSFPGISSSSYHSLYVVGQSLNVLYKVKSLGVNDTSGLYQFSTAKGESTYAPDPTKDLQVAGNLDPKYFGGISNTLTYRGISLNIFFEFKKQIGLSYLSQLKVPGNEGNLPGYVLSRWQGPGDQSSVQKLTSMSYGTPAANAYNYLRLSTAGYSDASYIRLKTISFSYALPDHLIQKLAIQKCSIYINAQNLLTLTRYKGSDPETQSLYGVPPLKTIAAGIQFTF